MGASRHYVVWIGRRPGIYHDWDSCRRQVEGFPGARYKSFSSLDDARAAFDGGEDRVAIRGEGPISESISVDAACSGNPGPTEYRGVDTVSGRTIFEGRLAMGTNNIGEFLAIVTALMVLREKGSDMPVYSDSETAIAWVRNGRCNTALRPGRGTDETFRRIAEAEKWLSSNTFTNRLLKWDTRGWGEVPADYGRK